MNVPLFCSCEPEAIQVEITAAFEKATGRTLYPAQLENLLLRQLGYRETQVRAGIQAAGESNCLRLARGQNLDEIGVFTKTPRLTAQPATARVRFSRVGELSSSKIISAGRIVSAKGGALRFALIRDLAIPAGELSVEGTVVCLELGIQGNALPAGSISTIEAEEDSLSVGSVTETANGAIAEDDERYRIRLMGAVRGLSVAGPSQSYRSNAMAVSPLILDVGVESPSDGLVRVYPLLSTGLPDSDLLEQIRAALNDEWVRPLTDHVEVVPPSIVPFAVVASILVLRGYDSSLVLQQARLALEGLLARRSQRLGFDLVRSELIAILTVPGVYGVQLLEPTLDRIVGPSEVAKCVSTTVNVGGVMDA